MHKRITKTHRRLALVLGLCAAPACEPLVDVNLKLVEPCNQRDKALSGVQTFQVSHDGPGESNAVILTKAGQNEPLIMRQIAEDVTVTVAGFVGDVNQDATVTSGAPKAIGRSLPIDVKGSTKDMDLVIPMGLADGFGQATDETGACQFSLNGHDTIVGRHAHTATYLPTVNKVLIAGGAVWVEENGQRGESFLRSAELFDPATGTFELVPDMPNTRGYHTATALPDGRVLIVGGFGVIGGQIQALTNGIIFDPDAALADPWERLTFRDQRALHTATLLADQQLVVIIGGCAGEGCRPQGVQDIGGDPTTAPKLTNSIEIYDIANNEIVAQPNVLTSTRAMHAASALEGGRVLVSGGVSSQGPVCNLEVFQTNGATVSSLTLPGTSNFSSCPVGHAQVTLDQSRVMFIGGQTTAPGGLPNGPGVDSVQFWNTTIGIETLTATMLSGRFGHHAVRLDDGSVLVMGGAIAAGGATAERLVAQGETYNSAALAEPMQVARARAAVAPLPNNQVVVAGGSVEGQSSSDLVEIYYGR